MAFVRPSSVVFPSMTSRLENVMDSLILFHAEEAKKELEEIIRYYKEKSIKPSQSIIKRLANIFEKFKNDFPKMERVYILEGMYHEILGKHEQALKIYQDAQAKFPHSWHLQSYQADSLIQNKQYEEAKKVLEKMIEHFKSMDASRHQAPQEKHWQKAYENLKIAETKIAEKQMALQKDNNKNPEVNVKNKSTQPQSFAKVHGKFSPKKHQHHDHKPAGQPVKVWVRKGFG